MNLAVFRPGELAAHGIDPYERPGRRFRLILTVLIVHVLIVVVPLIWAEISRRLNPPKIVMKVALVNLPEGNSLEVPKDQLGKPEPPASEPPAPEPPAPEPPTPEPPAPEPPAPEPPAPEPPAPEPTPTPPPPKVEPKAPKVKQQPKVEPKKVEPKKAEPKKAEPPKKKYLKPEDIIKTGKRVKTKNVDPKAEANRKAAEKANAEAQQRANEIRSQVAAAAAKNAGKKTYGSLAGGEQGIPATKEYRDYIENLKKTLEQRWIQPNSVELEGQRPAAKISLVIAKDGTIRSANFERTGNAAMDKSVADLLARLKAVTPPPQEMSFDVTLIVR